MAAKILVVEDEKNIVLSLRMLLEKRGYEVAVADSGLRAMELVYEFRPDVVLLDLVIPKMDGYMVCEAIKSEGETRGIKVVIISAKSDKDSIDRAYSLGADDYIVKPFTPEQVLSKIQQIH